MPAQSFLLLACLASVTVACDGLERPSAFFETYEAAREAGAMTRGWIPEWLPSDAIDIHEIHDLDTNEVCFRFELSRDARSRLLSRLEPLPPAEAAAPPRCRLRSSWWLPSGGEFAQIYQAPDRSWGYLAAPEEGGRVYAWSR